MHLPGQRNIVSAIVEKAITRLVSSRWRIFLEKGRQRHIDNILWYQIFFLFVYMHEDSASCYLPIENVICTTAAGLIYSDFS